MYNICIRRSLAGAKETSGCADVACQGSRWARAEAEGGGVLASVRAGERCRKGREESKRVYERAKVL